MYLQHIIMHISLYNVTMCIQNDFTEVLSIVEIIQILLLLLLLLLLLIIIIIIIIIIIMMIIEVLQQEQGSHAVWCVAGTVYFPSMSSIIKAWMWMWPLELWGLFRSTHIQGEWGQVLCIQQLTGLHHSDGPDDRLNPGLTFICTHAPPRGGIGQKEAAISGLAVAEILVPPSFVNIPSFSSNNWLRPNQKSTLEDTWVAPLAEEQESHKAAPSLHFSLYTTALSAFSYRCWWRSTLTHPRLWCLRTGQWK